MVSFETTAPLLENLWVNPDDDAAHDLKIAAGRSRIIAFGT
jgi:hypothetical protein